MVKENRNEATNPYIYLFGGAIAVVLAFILFLISVVAVEPGSVGIMYDRFNGGVQSATLGEGWHIQIPFVQTIYLMEVRTIKTDYKASAASKDLQVVNSDVAVSYHVSKESAPLLFKNLGGDFSDKIISPAVQDRFKAATAKYNAEDLIQNRELVRVEVADSLRSILGQYNIALDEVSITNFDYSAEFNNAIENKVVAQQNVLTSQNVLLIKQVEAQQKIVEAEGEANSTVLRAIANAQALKLQREQSTPELASIIIAQKWNGALPSTMLGSAMPLINLPSSTKEVVNDASD